jgi:hypothetical protein
MVVRFYMVDRISSREAVLVDDQGHAFSVPLNHFRRGIAENMVVRVPVEDDAPLDWSSATVDQDETERRAREAQSILERLRERDANA